MLTLSAVLLLHPPVKAGEAQTSATEVRVDNFTFGPDTVTVPVNSMVVWVNKDDIPHVIASNDGLLNRELWIPTKSTRTPSARLGHTRTTAPFIPRWGEDHRSVERVGIATTVMNP
jgi:plastocyanin